MATPILKLKKDAVAKGMDRDKARSASRATLEAFLSKGKAPVKKTPVKKATPARKAAVKKAPARKTPARKPAAKKRAPAKAPATRKTAKRPATKNQNGDAGRNIIGDLDYTITDGWNPREGSAVEVIFKTLKKFRGDVEKSFNALVGDISDFVGAKKADGSKRSKTDRENMLRYRISRTKFDFAIKTLQHEIATERVAYGSGPYATTRATKKPARRVAAKPAAKRVGRPAAKKATTRRRTTSRR
jgi:hypothetical protein